MDQDQDNLPNDYEVTTPAPTAKPNDNPMTTQPLVLSFGGKLGFLDLPPELRLKIYRLCFILDHGFRLPKPSQMKKYLALSWQSECIRNEAGLRGRITEASSQLLRCCKTIQIEALQVLYGENLFCAVFLGSFPLFAKAVDQSSFDMIRHLELSDSFISAKHARQFSRLTNLKTVSLTMYRSGDSTEAPLRSKEAYMSVEPFSRISQSPQDLLNDFIHEMSRRFRATKIFIKPFVSIYATRPGRVR
jgi:hypothetical protein